MVKNWFKKSSVNRHYLKPHPGIPEVDAIVFARGREIKASPYFKYVLRLRNFVVGKTVNLTHAGTTGFVLSFSDSSWVIVYLEDMQLHWQVGQQNSFEGLLYLINSPKYGDGFNPIPIDWPYADEINDIRTEISHSVGKVITKLFIGSDCFNFHFESDWEIETWIVPTSDGKPALRAFWEQW